MNCQKEITEIRYYPTYEISSDNKIEKINLDSTNLNFKRITDWIEKNQYADKTSIIEFEDNQVLKRIRPFIRGNGFIKERKILSLKSDSILIDNGYPISDLKKILKIHYTNKGQNYRYSDSPKSAGIQVTIDTSKTSKELKDFLINLTRTFDEVNREVSDTLELTFMFDYLRQTLPPPPPSVGFGK